LEAKMQLAVFGDQRMTLPPDWTTATAVALLGDIQVDASAGLGSGARLTFLGVAGDLEVRVPAGCRVRTDGVVLFGDPVVDMVQGDGPEVTITSFALFGDVRVTDKPL
jgi:hypothetical protein